MLKRFAALFGSLDLDQQVILYALLADQFLQAAGSQSQIDVSSLRLAAKMLSSSFAFMEKLYPQKQR